MDIFCHVAEEENLKIGALERSLGASKGVLSRAINNKTDVQAKWFLALVDKYPQYNYQKMLGGEFSTIELREPEEKYFTNNEFVNLKSDLKVIHDGMVKNFEVINHGILKGLKDQQDILRFVHKLESSEMDKTAERLNRFLKEHKY